MMGKVSRWLFIMILLALVVPLQPVLAVGENNYEIPLNELKKVEKKKPRRHESRRRKEKKKADSAEHEGEHDVPLATSSGTTVLAVTEAARHREELFETPDSDYISHETHSYVMSGKLTVVKAIFSRDGLLSAKCRFCSWENKGCAFVPMTREPESQFTYVATLPPLQPGATALRYRFIVEDAQGVTSYSKEFIAPVKPTSVLPGWQQNPSTEPVKAVLENPRIPLEGFSNVVVENAVRK